MAHADHFCDHCTLRGGITTAPGCPGRGVAIDNCWQIDDNDKYIPMPVIKETLQAISQFIKLFIWRLYKAIGFQVRDWDTQLATRYVLWKRLLIWGGVIVIVTIITLIIGRIVGGYLLGAVDSLGVY